MRFLISTRYAPVALLAGAAVGLSGGCREPRRSAPPPVAAAPRPTISPQDWEYLLREAREARDAGRLADAAVAYKKALEHRPDWVEGEWVLGVAGPPASAAAP